MDKRYRIAWVLAGIVLIAAAGTGAALWRSANASERIERTAAGNILVTPEWVRDNSNDLVILDYGRSAEDFAAGHVPGAAFVPRAVAWDTVDGVAGMLPAPELVAGDLEDAGVRTDRPVVVYDGGNGVWASRLFWALEYLGHPAVHVLDGGIAAWSQSQMPLSQDVRPPDRGDFRPTVRPELLADATYVLDRLDEATAAVTILDTRSPGEFDGSDLRSARGGHIPGSTNIEWTVGAAEDGRFRPISDLAETYGSFLEDGREVITLCQTGVRGAHTYVALRVLGHEDVRVYDGSWAEWGNSPDYPVERRTN